MIQQVKRQTKRVAIGIVGGSVLLAGIVMIPYPGPGWATVFVGLAILSTEFEWAQRLLHVAKGTYMAREQWLARQAQWVRALFWLLTCVVVITTIWLLNGYGFMNALLGLGWDWLDSPLPLFG
ncbi:MAG: TIGR02611 family protein [Candidatus Saccharimonadales bacterium]